MKLGIFAKTFPGNHPQTVLAAARNAGYDAVQYNMACSGLAALPSEISNETADAVRTAAETERIAIAALSATYNMIHPDPHERQQGRQAFQSIAAAAQRMGTRLLTLCTGSRDATDQWRFHSENASPAAWKELCDEFTQILPIAERHDVILGVEPELANVISSAERARKLLDSMASNRIKIVFDPANLFDIAPPDRQRFFVDQALELLGDDIALAHAKDRNQDGSFATAGTGVLDYPYYLTALRKTGFTGTLVTHGLSAQQAPAVASFLRKQLNIDAKH